jgi:UDP-N-acetylglucosamine--N-acetylmuramyl-(pentapeptide) pyrophosphoryl-undecaprenol N-acetylglucosamine transferase
VRLLVAGGGTGGHVFPAIALAQEVVGRHPSNDAVFVGTSRGLEATAVPRAGFPLELVDVRGLKGKGLAGVLAGLVRLPVAFAQSWRILRRWAPDVVVGVGGYASGPVVLAARLMGLPTAIQEQNAIPGLTNRILGHVVHAVFTAFPEAGNHFPVRKVQMLGSPIRRALLENYMRPVRKSDERLHLLVFGGSQGAHALNMRVVEALPHLADLRERMRITHQTGARDREQVERGYRACGFAPDVREFITDMSGAYADSDLVVCRAGATTLAELTVCKRPSILVPFPTAADNHQFANATSLVDAGAAVMIEERDLTGELLAAEIRRLLLDAGARDRMAREAGRLGAPQAASEIAAALVDMVKRRWGSATGQERGPGFRPVRPTPGPEADAAHPDELDDAPSPALSPARAPAGSPPPPPPRPTPRPPAGPTRGRPGGDA